MATAWWVRGLLAVGAGVLLGVGVGSVAARSQEPPPLPVDPTCLTDLLPCPTEDPLAPPSEPVPDDPEPSDPASPDPADGDADAPTPAPSTPAEQPTGDGPTPLRESGPAVPGGAPPQPTGPAPPAPPQVAPPDVPDRPPPGATRRSLSPLLFVSDPLLSSALSGTSIVVLTAALLAVAAFTTMTTSMRRGALVAHDLTGGIDVRTTRRWRTIAGMALFGIAAIVGMVGFTRIAGETLVPIQVVYLASTGLAVLLLAALGGALLIGEQLRADEHRLSELERSVTVLATHLAGQVSDPPRLLAQTDDDRPGDPG